MILPDVSVYINALHDGSPFHVQAKGWLEHALVDSESLAIWDVSLVAVYRLLTNPSMKAAVSEPKAVIEVLDLLRAAPSAVPIALGGRYWQIYSQIALENNVRGGLASDAMLAALAVEHGCRIATYDSDFGRFKGVVSFTP